MRHLYKKSEAGLVIILVVIIIIGLGWLVNFSQRECRSNKDCSSDSYCGSDFACHQHPIIQKTVVQYNFLVPSLVIGVAIIIAVIIFKWNKKAEYTHQLEIHEDKIEVRNEKEDNEIAEAYYKNSVNIKAP